MDLPSEVLMHIRTQLTAWEAARGLSRTCRRMNQLPLEDLSFLKDVVPEHLVRYCSVLDDAMRSPRASHTGHNMSQEHP